VSQQETTIKFSEAVRDGLHEALAKDSRVFLLGEGIADPSSFWGTTAGVVDRFGPERVVEMPVAENGLIGIAVGAAILGERPVLSLHRVEFSMLALDQIANNAAKTRYASNGQHHVPLVIRMVIGRGWGQGPAHAQSLESMYAMFPGLKVIMPAFARDAKGMLIAAIQDEDPVLVLEHRWLHDISGPVPTGPFESDITKSAVVRPGSDITVVATSYMTLEAVRAAEALKPTGCSVEVVDLRVLRPLVMAPIYESLEKTGHLITVDTGWVTLGMGAEIVSRVTTERFTCLKAAPIRIGLPDHPTPSSRGFYAGYYPSSVEIIRSIGETLKLEASQVEQAVAHIQRERGDVPVDVPDPSFKGPF
jgi:pyruvate/2-oxoglutarate/acetoin dehydrogenase E1 component